MSSKSVTLVLTFGAGSVSHPVLRPYPFEPVCISDVTIGHNSILAVLTNQIRDKGFTLLSSLRSSTYDPKMEYLSCILARHLPRKWNTVQKVLFFRAFPAPIVQQSVLTCGSATWQTKIFSATAVLMHATGGPQSTAMIYQQKTVKDLAVMFHQLNDLIERFTPQQFLRLPTVFQRTIKQQLLTVLLKPAHDPRKVIHR